MRCVSGRIGCWRSGSRAASSTSASTWAGSALAADLVVETTRTAYPDLAMCRSTRAGGISWSAGAIAGPRSIAATHWRDAAERARAAFDLAIVSVLLDAGAGPGWLYRDAAERRVGRPLRGSGAGEPRYVRSGRILVRPALAAAGRRGGPGGAITERTLARHFPGLRRQPAGGSSRAAPNCCAGSGRPSRRRSGHLCARRRSATGRPLRPSGGAGRRRTHCRAAHPAPNCCGSLGPYGRRALELGGVPLGDCWRHPAS